MLGLLRKELRSIRPFIGLVLAIIAFGVLQELFAGLPNAQPLAQAYGDYVALGHEGTTVTFILTFALASGLLVREYDEGTMEFLDSLPVSRSRVFAVKVAMALLVLALLVVLDVGTGALLHALSRNSLDRSFHVPLLATAIALRMCQLFVLLSLGLALSFLRRFGWLVLGLLFWGYILLRERLPAIALLDLFAIGEAHFEGDRWTVPRRPLAVQMSLAVVLMAIAYGMFLGLGDRLMRGFQRLTQTRVGNACLLAGGFMMAMVCGALVVRFMQTQYADYEPDENGVTIVYPSWTTSRARSQHYEFIYPTNLSGRARELIDDADSVHDKVSAFLGADAGGTIVVDATSYLPRHAGVAFWDKIRLDLSTTDHIGTLRSILGHETTHVFLERLSDTRLSDKMNSTRFFHEGVASYVEYRLFDPEQSIDTLRSVAAVMRSRDEVDFAEMVDSGLLSARRDTNLVYPLGELFVEAVVERYGEPAVGKIVRALVREDAPEGLAGLELWRDVFQACAFNLDEVVDEFFAKLDAAVDQHAELINGLPRLRGLFDADIYYVYVTVQWEPIEGWRPICRFRQSEDTSDRLYLIGESDDGELFYLDRSSFPASSLWYQLGLSDGEARVVYEPWRRVTID